MGGEHMKQPNRHLVIIALYEVGLEMQRRMVIVVSVMLVVQVVI